MEWVVAVEVKLKKTFKINGMHCKSCATLIKEELKDTGIKSIIDEKTGKAIIEFEESKISFNKIKELIKNMGYSIEE